jgi:flagellar protein FlaF
VYPNPLQAYQAVEKTTLSGRETEARVLTQAALQLKHCQENWNETDRSAKLEEALRFNQRIWSIFQSELGRPENPLPRKIKVDLLRLSKFIDQRIFEVFGKPSPEKLNILVDINRNIAAGLRNSPA